MAQQNWFYADGETRIGPVSPDEIGRLVEDGKIGPDTLVWRRGLTDWEPARQHFAAATGAPPLPGSAPPAAHWSAGPHAEGPGGSTLGADGLYIGAPYRNFGDAIRVCFEKFVRFKGRASRSEYWWFFLFSLLGSIATSLVDMALVGVQSEVSPISSIFSIVLFLPTMAVTWRRLHDTGRSGWLIGGFYIAILVVAVLVLSVAAGQVGYDVMMNNNFEAAGREMAGGLVGIMVLIGLAVLAYSITILVFLCQTGQPGPNRYG